LSDEVSEQWLRAANIDLAPKAASPLAFLAALKLLLQDIIFQSQAAPNVILTRTEVVSKQIVQRRWHVKELDSISEFIRQDLTAQNEVRDQALRGSRELIRLCANCIRAAHRGEWETASDLLQKADSAAKELVSLLEPYPKLLFAGYTQDGLKELAEAHLTVALMNDTEMPGPEALGVPSAAYLGGLCEAASELRRKCLDRLRKGDTGEAERLLTSMDIVYDYLVTFDFPDAVTGGLRRRVDQLRGVLERTRGDVTQALRQDRLMAALSKFEEHVIDKGDDDDD
jgi:translin